MIWHVRLTLRWFVWTSCLLVPFGVAWLHAERYGFYDFGSRYSLIWLVGYGMLFLAAAFGLGVPGLMERAGQALVTSAAAAAVPLVAASLFFLLVDPPIRSRLLVVGVPLVIFGTNFLASAVQIIVNRRSFDKDRALFVMTQAELDYFRPELDRPSERQFRIEGTLDPVAIGDDSTVLAEFVAEHAINLIVLSRTAEAANTVVAQVAGLHEDGMRIRDLTDFSDEWLGKFPISELGRTSLWFDIRDLQNGQYNRVKRIMDLTLALLILPVFALFIPIVATANLLGNRGPIFFRQERIGQRSQPFTIWKFRTMTVDHGSGGQGEWTKIADPRITPVGNLLRRTHLDELPQIINVLLGNLSIVGPRPEQRHYVEQLTQSIPFYSLRHTVKPGVTGWAQVKYPYGASEHDAMEKLQYELYYLRHQSLSLDGRICLRTIRSILFGEGR
jgi:exopolysaccharide biosynthesis polyprenyl glycosylphosphotransferase